ncbi:MAG: hypothetical protein ACI8RD_012182 [Bacillariaceae sp.]|jgi:hypothetical protein
MVSVSMLLIDDNDADDGWTHASSSLQRWRILYYGYY